MRIDTLFFGDRLPVRKLGGTAGLILIFFLPVSAQTRSRSQNSSQPSDAGMAQVTCASDDGQRKTCNADTRGGVLLKRQLSRKSCQAGSTWGFDTGGIWVDKGCSAEFSVKQYAYGTPDTQKTVASGTSISVRVDQTIDAKNNDGRVYSGVVSEDVLGQDGKIAIPQGSTAELIFKADAQKNLQMDLESLTITGHAVNVDPNNITAIGKDGLGANGRTAKYVGGGAAIGAIIGAIAGGGKGAAIGAGVGAGAGAGTQVLTRGKEVKIPAETVVTFRLSQTLFMGIADNGYSRGRDHYHYPSSIFDDSNKQK